MRLVTRVLRKETSFVQPKPEAGISPDDKSFLDIHQAAEILDISEEELWQLVHAHGVPTHNIAGAFLRFKTADIEVLKNRWRIERELFPQKSRYFAHQSTVTNADRMENLADFWYFNDFYIICSVLIFILLVVIVSFQ